jgi:hypothetical protein
MADSGHDVKRKFLANSSYALKFGHGKPVFARLLASLSGLRPDKSPRQAFKLMFLAAKNRHQPGSPDR